MPDGRIADVMMLRACITPFLRADIVLFLVRAFTVKSNGGQ